GTSPPCRRGATPNRARLSKWAAQEPQRSRAIDPRNLSRESNRLGGAFHTCSTLEDPCVDMALYEPGVTIRLLFDDARTWAVNRVPEGVTEEYISSASALLNALGWNSCIQPVGMKQLYAQLRVEAELRHVEEETRQWWRTHAEEARAMIADATRNL